MNNKGSDEVEFVVDFWGKFKNYVQEVEKKKIQKSGRNFRSWMPEGLNTEKVHLKYYSNAIWK